MDFSDFRSRPIIHEDLNHTLSATMEGMLNLNDEKLYNRFPSVFNVTPVVLLNKSIPSEVLEWYASYVFTPRPSSLDEEASPKTSVPTRSTMTENHKKDKDSEVLSTDGGVVFIGNDSSPGEADSNSIVIIHGSDSEIKDEETGSVGMVVEEEKTENGFTATEQDSSDASQTNHASPVTNIDRELVQSEENETKFEVSDEPLEDDRSGSQEDDEDRTNEATTNSSKEDDTSNGDGKMDSEEALETEIEKDDSDNNDNTNEKSVESDKNDESSPSSSTSGDATSIQDEKKFWSVIEMENNELDFDED